MPKSLACQCTALALIAQAQVGAVGFLMGKCLMHSLMGTTLPHHPLTSSGGMYKGTLVPPLGELLARLGALGTSTSAHTSSGVTDSPQHHLALAVQRNLSSVDRDVCSV